MENDRQSKIVVSKLEEDKLCRCQYCGVVIAEINPAGMVPPAEECYRRGNVPVPNFGWLCSQDCADKFEKEYDVKFARTMEGKVDYYKSDDTG